MTRFAEVFSSRHVILPVIHVETEELAVKNAVLAHAYDSDGVFLINHGVGHDTLMRAYAAVKKELPGFWVGINSLGRDPELTFREHVDGIWVDNAGIDEAADAQDFAQQLQESRHHNGWQGLYFGGVAFKYQCPVADLRNATRIAAEYMDVVTTSGSGTGSGAAVSKVEQMKSATPEFPLALASGVTPENVTDYLPHADCFLVATGISSSFTKLDPQKLQALVRNVRAWDGSVAQR